MARGTGEGKPPTARGGGFRRLSDSARKPLRQAANRYGFAEADLLARWPEAAGAAFAAVCRPVRVTYARSRGLGATLLVEAEGVHAPEVEMQAPQMLDRINAFYGYRAISRLKITQAAGGAGLAAGFAEAQAAWSGPETADADPAAAGEARALAEGVESPALRAALTRLGTYVLAARRGAEAGAACRRGSAAGSNRGD